MKYIGIISRYDDSKKFGFIKFDQHSTKWGRKDMFFHMTDCSFSPQINDVVVFDLGIFHGRAKAFDVDRLSQVIDDILANWDTYSQKDQKNLILALDKYYCFGDLPRKIKDIASHHIKIKDAELQSFFSALAEHIQKEEALEAERIQREEALEAERIQREEAINAEKILLETCFEDECKIIIEKIVSKIISTNYSDLEYTLSKDIPSVEDLRQAVILFLQNEKPIIIHKYNKITKEGRWVTHWKWDGSEDTYIEGEELEWEHLESRNRITINDISVDFDYIRPIVKDYGRYPLSEKEEIFYSYCFLKNSRELWSRIISACEQKREQIKAVLYRRISDSAREPILEAMSQYYSEKFPIFGENMYNWLRSNFCAYKTYNPYDFPYQNGMSWQAIINVNNYIRTFITSVISKHCTPLPDMRSFYANSVEKDGLLLSNDSTTLYAITDSNLQEINIPNSVTLIADGAFDGCREVKRIHFLGVITYIGHGVLDNNQLEISGDFSNLSFLGFNTSTANLTIKGETKPIKEWSYLYNKRVIDSTDITIKRVHIKHDE